MTSRTVARLQLAGLLFVSGKLAYSVFTDRTSYPLIVAVAALLIFAGFAWKVREYRQRFRAIR
jgi:hypothetical protein